MIFLQTILKYLAKLSVNSLKHVLYVRYLKNLTKALVKDFILQENFSSLATIIALCNNSSRLYDMDLDVRCSRAQKLASVYFLLIFCSC